MGPLDPKSQSLCDAADDGERTSEHDGDDEGGAEMSPEQRHRDGTDDKLKHQHETRIKPIPILEVSDHVNHEKQQGRYDQRPRRGCT